MPGWIGPTVAIALVVIALAFVAIAATALMVAREARDASGSLARELAELRADIAPALQALRKFGETGEHVAEAARVEIQKILSTSRTIRHEIERGVRRTQRRLADFDALLEVMQEEVEETALSVATTLRTVRTGRGVLGGVRRLLRRRGSRDDDE